MENSYIVAVLDDFFKVLKDEEVDMFEEDSCSNLESHRESPVKWYSEAGVSKVAIIPSEGAYVIKIDLDSYDGGIELSNNYLDIECRYSFLAEKAGLGDVFAKTNYWGTYRGRHIYLQERVRPDYEQRKKFDSISNTTLMKLSKRSSRAREKCEMTQVLTSALYNYYGEEKFEAILNFLNENEINDLHNGNWGFIGERPVIFDYSGFHEGSSYYSSGY